MNKFSVSVLVLIAIVYIIHHINTCKGNLDPLTNCKECKPHWININKNCDICEHGYDIKTNCTTCVERCGGENCKICHFPSDKFNKNILIEVLIMITVISLLLFYTFYAFTVFCLIIICVIGYDNTREKRKEKELEDYYDNIEYS